ncbi:MAG TPA: hypothetical protein VGC55_12895 [Dokdonella sp.]
MNTVKRFLARRGPAWAFAIAAGAGACACAVPAAAADGTPAGMVTFFNATRCPDGWTAVAAGQGRLLMVTTDAKLVGKAVGTALADHEDREHSHAYSFEVKLDSKHVSALDWAGNHGAARSKSYTVSGQSSGSTSNLPFDQLPLCTKTPAAGAP